MRRAGQAAIMSAKKKPNFFEKIGLALGLLKREVSVLVLGLDNSGKSTLLTHLNSKKGDITEVAPTVGFSVEGFQMGGAQTFAASLHPSSHVNCMDSACCSPQL